jgi:hypothetical protein
VEYYKRKAVENGEKQGEFMASMLSGDVPWAFIRQAQKLLRLNDKYGSARVEVACQRALAFGLMNVSRVEGIIKQVLDKLQTQTKSAGTVTQLSLAVHFSRPADYFSHHKESDHGHNNGIEAATEGSTPLFAIDHPA